MRPISNTIFFLRITSCVLSLTSYSCKTTNSDKPDSVTNGDQPKASSPSNDVMQKNTFEALQRMESQNKFEGAATIFSTFGSGGGGCGPSEEIVAKETDGRRAWAALNVFNTPGYHEGKAGYNPHAVPRPVPENMRSSMGLFQNGKNCGRWIRVSFPFNGKEVSTTFVVTDSCGDGNAWCRDDPGHVDLSVYEIARMVVPDKASCYSLEDARSHKGWQCYGLNWQNGKVRWEYIDPPHNDRSILFHWHNGAKSDWRSVIVSRLKNGISGIQVKGPSGWSDLKNEGDAGQRFQLPANQDQYEVRVYDRGGKLYPGSYKFRFPGDLCSPQCGQFRDAAATYSP